MSVSTRTLPKGAEGSAGSYKINLRNILHMYTIGAVFVCFKPFFFCFIPKFPKDFKNFDQTLKFLNLGVLILETRKMIMGSRDGSEGTVFWGGYRQIPIEKSDRKKRPNFLIGFVDWN